jgi:choice-of-anchor A domain-containing protein
VRSILITTAALAGVFAGPAGAATLLDYSVYSLGDYSSLYGGSVIGGRVAVAGNANINSEAIGRNLTSADSKTPTVIVGGNVSYDNSTLKYGSVVFGGANKSGRWTQVQTPNGSVTQGTPLDFSALGNMALSYSAGLAAQKATGSLSSLYGTGTLNAGSGINIFYVSGKDLASLHKLRLVGDSGGKVVINVDAAEFSRSLSFDTGGFAADSVLFNFYNATDLDLGGWDFGGSLLAPEASITLRGGNILGNVVAGDFQSAGAKVAGNAYAGYLDAAGISAIPEPDTWLMMLAGFTLVGIMVRRRRYRTTPVLA